MSSILVVAAERSLAQVIQQLLQSLGHDILAHVTSGKAAIDTAVAHNPDLVLVTLERGDSAERIEAAAQIQAGSQIPIVYLAHSADETLLERAIASQPYGYLLSPIDRIQFRAVVEVALRRRNAEQRLPAANAISKDALALEQLVQERTAQLQQALEFEALLKRVSDRIRDLLDETEILQTIVTELRQVLALEECSTGIYDESQTAVTILDQAHSQPQTTVPQPKVVPMVAYRDLYGTLRQGQWVQFCWIAPPAERLPSRSRTLLVMPIIDKRRTIGDLWLAKPHNQWFTTPEIRLVQQIANQCAIALRQSRLYADSQSQVQQLAKLHSLKDDFLNAISHELRTPIANVKMATQMLEVKLRQAGLLTAEPSGIARYLNILQEECNREIHLINDLLDLSRIDAETTPPVILPIQLQDWLPHLVEPFQFRTQQQQQQFKLKLPATLPNIYSDQELLGRIMTELLTNACKYTPPGETIELEVSADSNGLIIRVTNTGIEIPPAEQQHIFDKFYRIPNADPYRYDGTGLGLALVKKMVQRLSATITVSSEQGRTTFRVILPHAEAIPSFDDRVGSYKKAEINPYD